MWGAVGRLLLVPLGALLAAVSAAAVIVTLGLELLTHAAYNASPDDAVNAAFDAVRDAPLLLAGATLIPALAVIVIGEVARIRSVLYYVLGGGASLAVIPLLAGAAAPGAAASFASPAWQVLATAGFAGGLVYWLVAGRSA